MESPFAGLPPLVLASASPRRQVLLREMGIAFEVHPSTVPEVHDPSLPGTEVCLLNARAKAGDVARRFPHALVLGADTLVCLENHLLGKPADLAEAERMLLTLQGRRHEVVTGVSLICLAQGHETAFAETTEVLFRPLSPADVRAYFQRVDPLDKAGAYAIQEHGDMIVARTEGSYSNVVGLPVERLQRELARWPARA